jgi:hypothetical protein
MDQTIIEQIKTAARNWPAGLLGAALGGIVPLITYTVAHSGIADWLNPADPRIPIVAGGLAYSAKTVWQWGNQAFDCIYKATGFVVLLEGVMVTSSVSWLAQLALCYLIAINAIATACQIARDDQPEPVPQVIAPPVEVEPEALPVLIPAKKPGRPSNAERAARASTADLKATAKQLVAKARPA